MIIKTPKKEYKIHLFYIFIGVLTLIKIGLMFLFSSDYQNLMFEPFVKTFIINLGKTGFNIYDYYYNNHLITSFPYPPLMLLLLCPGSILTEGIGVSNPFIVSVLFKVPILIFDLLGMYFIMKLFPNRRKYIGVLYYASPIIIYSGYMHGQLDIIPTTFLLIAIYYATGNHKNRILFSVVALTAALTCKFHILAVLPLFYIYLYRKEGVKSAFKHLLCTFGLTGFIIFPFYGEGFINTVLFNNEQTLLTQVFFSYVNIKIYLPILAVLIIYLMAFNLNSMNKDLFISFCGVLFTSFLALIPPMPGWYTWIVPFITMYFICVKSNKFISAIIYATLNFLYLVYFIFLHNNGRVDLYFLHYDLSYLKIDNNVIKNTVFTILVGTLVYIIFLLYKSGVTSNSLYKRRNLPFTIGISGDSGSGKSTLIKAIEECLGLSNILYIEGDGDHKWERGEKMWDEYTHLNPKANYLYRQAEDISTLRTGASVMRVEYNHDTGKFSQEHKIRPKKYIVMCGLHSLYLPQMRKNLDLKIYMDIEENLRRYWKISRDTAFRGYSKERIITQIEDRMDDAKRYIYPQKYYADLVIRYYDMNLQDCLIDDYQEKICLKLTLSADIDLEKLINEVSAYGVEVEYDYSDDLVKQTVCFSGNGLYEAKIPFERIANMVIPQLDEITQQTVDAEDNIDGILKIVLLEIISYKMRGEK